MNKSMLVLRWVLLLLLGSLASCSSSASGPRLVAGPGMTLDEVKALSTVHLGTFEYPDGSGITQPDGPHDVLFHGMGPDIKIPQGRVTVVSTVKTPRGATVESMIMTPMMNHLSCEDALALADVLGDRFMVAGWTVKRRRARADILEAMKGPDPARGATVVVLAFGHYRTLIELGRGADGAFHLGGLLGQVDDGILVTVRVHNDEFEVDRDKR